MFDILEADIVVLQEIKIQKKDLTDDIVLVPGWDCYFSVPKTKRGYAGVAIYTRQATCAPIRAEEGITGGLSAPQARAPYRELPIPDQIGGYPTDEQLHRYEVDPLVIDAEGRCVLLEFPALVLIGVYCPAHRDMSRDQFRLGFLDMLDARVRNLVEMGKNVIVTGDLNISRAPIDAAHAQEEMEKQGTSSDDFVSTPARRLLNQWLPDGVYYGHPDPGRAQPVMWDLCRGFHPRRRGMYTCWEQKINARPGNFGSRIDYVLCSLGIKDWFEASNIQEGLMGSDHCPVYAVAKDRIEWKGAERDLRDLMNPPGIFAQGTRIGRVTLKDTPALSGRLIPEFDRRGNIRDMFKRSSTSGSKPDAVAPPTLASDVSACSGSSVMTSPTTRPNASALPVASLVSASGSGEPSPGKRQQASSPDRPTKRSKARSTPAPVSDPGPSQQSLTAFLQPRPILRSNAFPTRLTMPELPELPTPGTLSLAPSPSLGPRLPWSSQPSERENQSPNQQDGGQDTTTPTVDHGAHMTEDEAVFDPIVSKESWSRLFTQPAAPRCESHREPCQLMTTKKSGVNCGRAFWMCARPLGPSGSKERGTQWRCPTFIWRSERNGGV
ncbi:MAG: Class II abasic (AP) endonuclease [Thelocarpon superellum]|nr:MAG: Class II abasic (AP) endonuclease [Thelocarpon superellum]